jgi:PAS domain S-box-containing protein
MMEPTMNPIAEVSLIRLIRSSAKANEQILDQLKFFRDIIGKLNIGIFIHDLTKLRHIWTNNNFVNFTGYTDSEIKSFGPEWAKDNYHPDDFHIMKERIEYFRENKGDTYSGIYRVKHKKGHWVWIYSNSTVFKRDANGIPEQIIGISIDFTANFKTDRQLDELTRENHRLRNRLLISTLIAPRKGNPEDDCRRKKGQRYCPCVKDQHAYCPFAPQKPARQAQSAQQCRARLLCYKVRA